MIRCGSKSEGTRGVRYQFFTFRSVSIYLLSQYSGFDIFSVSIMVSVMVSVLIGIKAVPISLLLFDVKRLIEFTK